MERSDAEMDYLYGSSGMDNDFTKWRLDIDEMITLLRHHLRGEYWSTDENRWVKTGARLMNNDGVDSICSVVNSLVHKNTFLTNYDDHDIMRIQWEYNRALVRLIFFKWDHFDIDKDQCSMIVTEIIRGYIYPALKRAFGAGERESLHKSERIVRTHVEGEAKQGGVRIPSPFGRGGGEE